MRKPLQPEERMGEPFEDYNGVEVTGARYEIPEVEARIRKVKGKIRLQPVQHQTSRLARTASARRGHETDPVLGEEFEESMPECSWSTSQSSIS